MKCRFRIYYIFFVILLFSTALGPKWGVWRVEKSESFIEQKHSIKKSEILFFEPAIEFVEVKESVNKNYFERKSLIEEVRFIAEDCWEKFDVNAAFIRNNEGLKFEYFQKLLSLKQDLSQTQFLQQHPFDRSRYSPKELSQRVFSYPPKIAFEYSNLVNELGQRYIGYFGVFGMDYNAQSPQMITFLHDRGLQSKGKYFIYYFTLVDLKKSEILYRELKYIPKQMNKLNLQSFIFQSYEVFSENLTE